MSLATHNKQVFGALVFFFVGGVLGETLGEIKINGFWNYAAELARLSG